MCYRKRAMKTGTQTKLIYGHSAALYLRWRNARLCFPSTLVITRCTVGESGLQHGLTVCQRWDGSLTKASSPLILDNVYRQRKL